ncbi:putative amidophosphoribosyltransferase [Paenibacillus pabuli]|uniref:Amidophosphoribosyltransferase n=2 Tax=Paenibacillus pabuli TaxID=1472 RepID=A0ABX9BMW9_9BACL|nr:putative amidophosphoribosyltransferase [Paenibacillus pabuli]
MSNWLSSITDHVHQLTHRLHRLLAPPGATCLTCGTRAILSPIYPGICPRCVQQIPWIHSIRCLRCGRGIGCPDCVRSHMQNRSFICNRSAVQYNALMKEWIGMYKFRGHERYAPLLTALVIQAFQAMSEELNPVLAKETLAPVAHPATPAQSHVDASSHPHGSSASTNALVHRPSGRVITHAPVQPLGSRQSISEPVHLHVVFAPAHTLAQHNSHSSYAYYTHAHPDAPPHHRRSLLQNNKPQWRPDAVTYVPVSNERLAERGFNQAERLAAGLAAAVRLPVVDLLQRRINTTKQSFKTRGERMQTMQDAFALQQGGMEIMFQLYKAASQSFQKNLYSQAANSYAIGQEVSPNIRPTTQGWQIPPLRLLLIDDIYTTGSTLDACGQVILNAGSSINLPIEIYTLTLARS